MMNKIINSMDALADAKLFIDDTPGISIMELTAKTRRMKQEHGIGMVVVDYLQLVTPVRDGRSNREQEIAQISRSLKALAKELNIPVIALAQLNRSVEQRSGDRRPQLSDLRESGSIEQDADMVIFLSRPEMYGIKNFEDGSSTKDITEVVIGKQRNGPIGTVRLLFLKKYGRFQSTANSYLTAADSGQQQPEPARGDGYPEASLPEPPPLDMDSFINNSDAAPF
jgi:replicative DNA helicase